MLVGANWTDEQKRKAGEAYEEATMGRFRNAKPRKIEGKNGTYMSLGPSTPNESAEAEFMKKKNPGAYREKYRVKKTKGGKMEWGGNVPEWMDKRPKSKWEIDPNDMKMLNDHEGGRGKYVPGRGIANLTPKPGDPRTVETSPDGKMFRSRDMETGEWGQWYPNETVHAMGPEQVKGGGSKIDPRGGYDGPDVRGPGPGFMAPDYNAPNMISKDSDLYRQTMDRYRKWKAENGINYEDMALGFDNAAGFSGSSQFMNWLKQQPEYEQHIKNRIAAGEYDPNKKYGGHGILDYGRNPTAGMIPWGNAQPEFQKMIEALMGRKIQDDLGFSDSTKWRQ